MFSLYVGILSLSVVADATGPSAMVRFEEFSDRVRASGWVISFVFLRTSLPCDYRHVFHTQSFLNKISFYYTTASSRYICNRERTYCFDKSFKLFHLVLYTFVRTNNPTCIQKLCQQHYASISIRFTNTYITYIWISNEIYELH